jgi:hypothetical protein
VDGTVIDRFTVRSEADGPFRPGFHLPPNRPRSLELDPAALGLPSGSRMRVDDINGRAAANVDANQGPVSLDLDRSGLLFLRTVGDRSVVLRTFVLLP